MDVSVIEKMYKNFAAFFVGVMVSGATVWSVAENLYKKEITIIEREKAELQRQLSEAETVLKTRLASPNGGVAAAEANSGRKQELEALIQSLDTEIKTKKVELARNAPITFNGPKDEGYTRVESELNSLQQQRNSARQLLIGVVAGKP